RTADHAICIHQPDLRLVGVLVVPEDVRLAVIVEIARGDDAPGQADEGRIDAVLPQHGGTPGQAPLAHEPDLGLAGLRVVPDDVAERVAVHVVGADDRVRRADERRTAVLVQDGRASLDAIAGHQPDLHLAVLLVVPEDVGTAIAVEIPAADDP